MHKSLETCKLTLETPPKLWELRWRKVCLSCNLGQWKTKLAFLASQSLTSPSLLPVKKKLVFGIVEILVTLPLAYISHNIINILTVEHDRIAKIRGVEKSNYTWVSLWYIPQHSMSILISHSWREFRSHINSIWIRHPLNSIWMPSLTLSCSYIPKIMKSNVTTFSTSNN